MPIDAPNHGRNAGIDLLRGIAIVLVVMHHVALRIPLKAGVLSTFFPKWFINAFLFNGYEAVFIFFVISGFLITLNSLARWGSLAAMDMQAFYVRRAARILPGLLLLVAVLSALHLMDVEGFVIRRAGQSLDGAVVSALGLYLNWYEGRTGYLPAYWDVLWSLSIEEVFYIAFPILCLTLRRNWLLLLGFGLLAASLPMSRAALTGNEIWQEKAYLPGMAGIAMGVCGALIAARYRPDRRLTVSLLCALGTTGIVAVLFYGGTLWPILGNGLMLLLTFSAICLVLSFHWQSGSPRPWTIPGTGWLRSFGRLSYEIYLTHMFVILPLILLFKANGAAIWWGVLWYVPALLFSWLLGWLFARFVTVPSERWIRLRFVAGERRPTPMGVAPTVN